MIKLEGISKTYGYGDNAFEALNDINLEISKGEFIAIIGASGSGKSTLMNILGALDTPTSGRYLLKGKDVSHLDDKTLSDFRNKEVGFVFQRFNLLNNLSVFDNVALPARYSSMKNVSEAVLECLKTVGLQSKDKNMANALSGGQMQRVAIARALIMSPSIIMADEPTGNLDSYTGVEIMSLIKDLHKQGHTIILVTHDSNIAAYAQRIIEIKDGEIISDKQSK
ncbi:MAG: Macrolide export ATP-binding/permease protein MacB [candidate division WS6 bacterium 34_10]|uniref:Macrolide export ATP-binding/permease protein MacB n=1 Tax=candidate division WS6 bacterium 34_10 TaxID=1641389 RepID=A0A124FXC0_9BACT|nr:MAG: Macrolide export ATP-binding/permease protein MacB [candidate division WS6 bacterium 34_10]